MGLGTVAGIVNGISTLSLYRSFEIGKMAVVAPISASYPALTVILSLFSGERLTGARVAGVALILAGVVLVARGEASASDVATPDNSGRRPSRGIGWALVSAVGFGVLFWFLGKRIVPAVGFAATVWLIRLTSSVLTVLVILALKQTLAPPRESSTGSLLLSMGLLDTCGFVLNNRGMELEQVSVVSVLGSLYGAVTVLFAAIFLRESLTRAHWCGIVAIFGGIALISR